MKKRVASLCLILTAVMVLVCFGCSNAAKAAKKSPSEVVKIAYELGNEGKYSDTEQYLSTDILTAIKNQKIAPLKKTWDTYSRNGSIVKIDIIEEVIRGEGANVKFRLYFKDGKAKEASEPLINENGHWKLTI